MLRAFLRAHRPSRLPLLLGAVLLPALAHAQTLGTTPGYSSNNPWAGISLVVTPAPQDAPVESEALPPPSAAAPPGPAEAAPVEEPQIADTPVDPWSRPSLYTSLELGLGDPTPTEPEKPAPNAQLPQRNAVAPHKAPQLPTSVDLYKNGPASVAVSTNMSASAPVSSVLNRQAGGGSGEVEGRVGYTRDNLSVYGTGNLGASASTGAPSVNDGYAVGSSYETSLQNLGLGADHKLGASVEMNNSNTVNTGVELRAPLGSYQRYISVERSTTNGSDSSGVVKAGVLGKF